MYFIHKVVEESSLNQKYEKDDFINLHSHTIRELMGRRLFYDIRKNLIDKGVIEINNSYLVGKYSKSYRLTPKFRNVSHDKIKVKDKKLLKNLAKNDYRYIKYISGKSEHQYLFNQLNNITIDHKQALHFINQKYEKNSEKYKSYTLSVDYIQEKRFFFIVDKIAGRVHTNITNLSRDLRKFLYLNGKPFKDKDLNPINNVDICNSQPLFFNILILKREKQKAIALRKSIFIFERDGESKVACKSTFRNLSYSGTISSYKSPADIELYRKLTSEGKFYEFLMEKGGVKLEDRQEFKKGFFGKVFFCKTNEKYMYKTAKIFKRLFPNVYEIIKYYKKDDYKQLAIKLQRAEANLMIGHICKRISIEKPDMFITTIHDSIMVTKENTDYVREIILDEFKKNFNLKPTLKTE